jgi:hypothetical protein
MLSLATKRLRTLPFRSTPLASIHFHRLTKLASTPLSRFTYPLKSAELMSKAQFGEEIPRSTLQKARLLVFPAVGPSAASNLSNIMVMAELSRAIATEASPGLHPLPSISTVSDVRLTPPAGGRTGAAAGMAAMVEARNARINVEIIECILKDDAAFGVFQGDQADVSFYTFAACI